MRRCVYSVPNQKSSLVDVFDCMLMVGIRFQAVTAIFLFVTTFTLAVGAARPHLMIPKYSLYESQVASLRLVGGFTIH